LRSVAAFLVAGGPTLRHKLSLRSQSFTERVITTLADGAYSVFALDVDGDGDVDALSASQNDDNSVFAIDVDGDGDVDVLSASSNDDAVAWYENDGSQSFTERVITNAADGPYPVFAIDVDGDGDVDALSASYGDDTVAWYENDCDTLAPTVGPSASLTPTTTAPTPKATTFCTSVSFSKRVVKYPVDQVYSVFAIDVDGDGDVDVLSASSNADTVVGSFASKRSHTRTLKSG
jgi:hypothetical protein